MTKYTLESSREWYNNLPGKRASAAMIIRHRDKYLLIKDDYKEAMTMPSGVIDPNEAPKQTAIRETSEEVGISFHPDDVRFFGVAYISEHYGFKDRFHFYFITEIDESKTVDITLQEGMEYFKWVEASEIGGTLTGDRPAYTRLSQILQSGDTVSYFEV